ncbi:DUF4249 domain-containing protein [uncultured Roseivirga sp.]|uniref:DUF4249 domain-containing protein n=1 Tax=uncultured Roseivirga sp. TaxID=543088 RepID=UPI0030DB6F69|tara:strand:- start:71948 stop:73222 length:1275 start_codon:yes stop_codon:yes gene_type:complete
MLKSGRMSMANYKTVLKLCLMCLVMFVAIACIEEIDTTSFTFEKVLVVDANISDQAKAHEVHLTYTSPIDGTADGSSNAASGATIWVEDDLGNRVDFTEQRAGFYLSPDTFAGEVGRSYTLLIITNEGNKYQSSFEKLVQAPEVSAIYNKFAIKPLGQKAIATPGVQFFIDVEDDSQSTQFYRYEWTDAHQVVVPYPKKYETTIIYPGGMTDPIYILDPFNTDVSECYRESRFDEVVLASSASNSNRELREIPIFFSEASNFDVTTKYSIEVTQRAISVQAYSYYRKIELFNESNGSLFDKQHGAIVGNILSMDSPDEKVLGYFEVSGASSKRVFLEPSQLDEKVMDYVVRTCEEYDVLEFEGDLNSFYKANGVPEILLGDELLKRAFYEVYDYDPLNDTKFLAHRLCIDCRNRGSIGKPDWWQ